MAIAFTWAQLSEALCFDSPEPDWLTWLLDPIDPDYDLVAPPKAGYGNADDDCDDVRVVD